MDKNTENFFKAIMAMKTNYPDAYNAIINIVNCVAKTDKVINELTKTIKADEVVRNTLADTIEKLNNKQNKSKKK